MSKRFTDTAKWRDPWFRKLRPNTKLLWNYVCDCCDAAGVWVPDDAAVRFDVGIRVDLDEALAALGDRVEVMPNGRWRLVKFLSFQYPKGLSVQCRPHRSIIDLLHKHGIAWASQEASPRPVVSPTVSEQYQDKDKDTDKDKDSRRDDPTDVTTPRPGVLAPTVTAEMHLRTLRAIGLWLKDDEERAVAIEAIGEYGGAAMVARARAIKHGRPEGRIFLSELTVGSSAPAVAPAVGINGEAQRTAIATKLVARVGWERCADAADIPRDRIGDAETMVEAMRQPGIFARVVTGIGEAP